LALKRFEIQRALKASLAGSYGAVTMLDEFWAHRILSTDRVPSHQEFQECVARSGGGRYLKNLSCWDQYLAMAFAQLTYRESLREIEACLRSVGGKLYHMGFRGKVARSTLADANESCD
jgi:hypothetical protein